MDNNTDNRMTTPRKRGPGRPPKAEIEARPPATPLVDNVPLPVGMICPCCGRGMVPKILRSDDAAKTCTCTLCAKRFKISRAKSGSGWLAQPL
jgi:hypothetical protein